MAREGKDEGLVQIENLRFGSQMANLLELGNWKGKKIILPSILVRASTSIDEHRRSLLDWFNVMFYFSTSAWKGDFQTNMLTNLKTILERAEARHHCI